MSDNKELIKECEKSLDDLETALQNANENGLFKEKYDTYKEIVSSISAAYEDLSSTPPKIAEAKEKYSLACFHLNQTCNSKEFWWRFNYSYGGPALMYLLGFLGAIFMLWFLFQPSILNSEVLWIPTWAFLWGSVGGILYGFWWLWQHSSRRNFRKAWYVWYVLLPLIGAILGALAYLIFIAGFIATTGTKDIDSQYFVMLLSAISGFSSRWAVDLLEKITTMISVGK